ncbi:MAG: long-chain fatty acid--CoA ligase [Anaerolineae bacterium]|jgi:long-chain acyl-CoA synthetase|nr:long-chain fatty acid--CoA ligase [Anaerolineae bacterium]MBT4310347.1 long-chain fatty acid--CoA ligase [Anaerolineae bacterium]MBT4458862.1 long-chain fatty acid--CoA ligase [Anaerolineae bacterium]MBT6062190.1 long-chain fatty acid--CoA ligase [Anaerolineae bacterium]MBT6322651.1 long-chain fatty acid--CoA ligase [Anaerolineae bacterium]
MEQLWIKNYDEGVPKHIDYPQKPLFHFLEEGAAKHPDKACTIFKGATISYQEMNDLSDTLAGALADLGVKKGDRVGIFMPNTPQFVMAYYAVLKAGGVVVASNPLYTATEIAHQANDAGIEVMLAMSNFYKTVKEAQPDTKIKTVIVTNLKETLPALTRVLFTLAVEKKGGHRIEGGLPESDLWMKDLLAKYQPSDRPKLDIGPDDSCLFQYSGGTTGVPKAAVALHRNIVANSLQISNWMTNLNPDGEVVLMAIPLFHVYGMVAGMNFGLSTGSTLVMVPNPRDLKDVLDNISKYRASIFPAVPTLYNAINNHPDVLSGKYDLSSIKACISGSAALMRETKDKFEDLTGGKVFEGYGLSEAPTATHCNPMGGVNKTGSIGMPLPDVDCRIIDLDDGETEMAMGEIGEIIVKGPQVMHGYHNMPTETANSLREWNGETWLYTGDIARIDEDGYFYIVDRKKELIKPGGFQVWPREVEEAISDHPKVLEVGVAGIPDPYRGETVKAWVVVKEGETLTVDEIRDFAKEKLAKYKVPSHVEFRDELPKTTVGKILRRELVRQHKASED